MGVKSCTVDRADEKIWKEREGSRGGGGGADYANRTTLVTDHAMKGTVT